ncbi:GIY-YIG nuclease family protein [Candidatus Omnitrophota bacterium]
MSPVRPLWHYTYVLLCINCGTFYTGITKDLEKRLAQHDKGYVRYTKSRLPVKLVYFEACLDKNDAYRRERYLKSGMGKRYLKNRIEKGLTGCSSPVLDCRSVLRAWGRR